MVEEERRRNTLYRVQGSISFDGRQVRDSGQVYNVSATGCSVGAPCHVSLGSQLRISLQFGGVDPIIIDTAVVRWVRQHTFGVEFLFADTAQTVRLGACLEGLH